MELKTYENYLNKEDNINSELDLCFLFIIYVEAKPLYTVLLVSEDIFRRNFEEMWSVCKLSASTFKAKRALTHFRWESGISLALQHFLYIVLVPFWFSTDYWIDELSQAPYYTANWK